MPEIRNRPAGVERPLVPPVEPVVPIQPEKKFTEGEPRPAPEVRLSAEALEGEELRSFLVVDALSAYDRDGRARKIQKKFTKAQAESQGLVWDDGEKT